MLFPTSAEDNNSFDDFFDEDMYKIDGGDEENKDRLDDFEDLFSSDPFPQDNNRLSSSFGAQIGAELSPPQPWRQGVWCLNQKQSQPQPQAQRLTVAKTRRHETKRPDPISTMNGGHQNLRSAPGPPSPVEVTSGSRTKRFVTSPTATGFDPTLHARPPFSREATLSPSPMYAQLPVSPRSGHGDTSSWQQDFQNFHLRLPYEPNLTPPSAASRPDQHALSARAMNTAVMAQNQSIQTSRYPYLDDGHTTPGYAAAIDPLLLESHRGRYQASHQGYHMESHLSRNQHALHEQSSLPSPASGTFPSSGSSAHSREARTHTSNTNVSMHSQTFASPLKADLHPPLPALEPEETYPALVAPSPKRRPHPILHNTTTDSSLTGLGIQYPEIEQMSQAVLYEPQHQGYYHNGQAPVGVALPYPPATMPATAPMSSYPPLPPPPSCVFSDTSPFTTPRKQRRSPSRSPSPPISPTHVSPRRNPPRSPTRNVTDYSHSRRKSIHKSGPIRDSGFQEPLSAPRTRSASRPPRTPKGPKTPTGGAPVIDFVNFTPKDASKLLNDVAPSGSSKTRARRELEAREKRKKLNEAALKAVEVAGGDVAAFERAILK